MDHPPSPANPVGERTGRIGLVKSRELKRHADRHALPARPWRPRVRYHVLQEARLDPSGPMAHGNVTAVLFALEQCTTVEQISALVGRLASMVSGDQYTSLRRAMATWMRVVLAPARGIDLGSGDVGDLSEVKDMLTNRVRQWDQAWKESFERGFADGKAQGEAIGHAQGHAQGQAWGAKRGLWFGSWSGALAR